MASLFLIYIYVRCKLQPELGPSIKKEERKLNGEEGGDVDVVRVGAAGLPSAAWRPSAAGHPAAVGSAHRRGARHRHRKAAPGRRRKPHAATAGPGAGRGTRTGAVRR